MTVQDTLTLLSKPVFWAATVTGSLALSILGNLLTPWAGRRLERFSSKRKNAALKTRVARYLAVWTICEKPERLTQTKLDSLNLLHGASFVMLTALGFLSLSSALSWASVPTAVRIILIIGGGVLGWLAWTVAVRGVNLRELANHLFHQRQQ